MRQEVGDGLTAQVHVRLRLGQHHGHARGSGLLSADAFGKLMRFVIYHDVQCMQRCLLDDHVAWSEL